MHLGGHSKGGNVAVYSAIFAKKEIQNRIIDVTNHDGPGFDKSIIERGEYKRVLNKIFYIYTSIFYYRKIIRT